jgi:cell division protein FtsW
VQLNVKHLATCIAALVACEAGFLLTRNHEWIRLQKKYIYGVIGVLILCILLFTGSRSMWITIGSFSVQPSEFIKPCFVLICAASIVELHKKVKVLFFYVSKDTLCLCAMAVVIFALQWWCRDLGSLPTFAAVFACAMVCRCCYPRAKISKTAIAVCCVGAVAVLIAAWTLAPSYVQERLHVDIWADPYGQGYQQCQALIGIARGGWLGLGPGCGNLCNVFAYEADIVFATICEEWGLLYAVLTVLIILIMLTTVLMNPPKSYYHATMTVGVVAVFVAQMALNIFGSCNLIPFTGVTLPFISQGGSSMVTCGFMVGMLKAGQSPLFRHKQPKKKKKAVQHRTKTT